jgi:hypothetical protein
VLFQWAQDVTEYDAVIARYRGIRSPQIDYDMARITASNQAVECGATLPVLLYLGT